MIARTTQRYLNVTDEELRRTMHEKAVEPTNRGQVAAMGGDQM
jgi:hypothetical protein